MVVHTLDRLARNQKIQCQVLDVFGKARVGFASIVEGHDFTTPTGKLLLSMMGAFNEFYSDQLAAHVSKAARQRAHEGLRVGPLSFGYEPGGAGFPPVVVPHEAKALQDLWRRRALGETMGSLAAWMNARGFKTREGNLFTAHALKDIFENTFYIGKVRYKGEDYPGQHEAIIRPRCSLLSWR